MSEGQMLRDVFLGISMGGDRDGAHDTMMRGSAHAS